MHVAFRESPRHLESSFTSRLLPRSTTSRTPLGGTDINSHKFPFKRARIPPPLPPRPSPSPSPYAPPFFSKAKDSVCLLIRVCKERYSSFPSTKRRSKTRRRRREERRGRRDRGNKRLRDLAIFNDPMKAGEIRKERIVLPRVFEKRDRGRGRRKKELVCPKRNGGCFPRGASNLPERKKREF